jgi:hypothetical protein
MQLTILWNLLAPSFAGYPKEFDVKYESEKRRGNLSYSRILDLQKNLRFKNLLQRRRVKWKNWLD